MASENRQFNAGYVVGSAPTWSSSTLPALGQDRTGITDFIGAVLSLNDPTVGNSTYKLVHNSGASTAATSIGQLVYYIDTYNLQVSNSFSDAGTRNTPAGVAASVIPIGGYGWVQVTGNCPYVLAGGGTNAYGLKLMSDATAGQVVTAGTAGTAPVYPVVGTALAATSANWSAAGTYTLGQIVLPTVGGNAGGVYYAYIATTAGTGLTPQPSWPTTAGATVADGTVVWTAFVRATNSATYVPAYLHVGNFGASL